MANVDITRLDLSARGFVKIAILIFLIILALMLARWAASKATGFVSGTTAKLGKAAQKESPREEI